MVQEKSDEQKGDQTRPASRVNDGMTLGGNWPHSFNLRDGSWESVRVKGQISSPRGIFTGEKLMANRAERPDGLTRQRDWRDCGSGKLI